MDGCLAIHYRSRSSVTNGGSRTRKEIENGKAVRSSLATPTIKRMVGLIYIHLLYIANRWHVVSVVHTLLNSTP